MRVPPRIKLSSRAGSPRAAGVVGRQKASCAKSHQQLFAVSKGITALLAHHKIRGICFSAVLLLAAALLIASSARAGDKGKTVTWKPITQALLRVDDQPVKNWNVYGENKKGDPLLLEMGNRYLLIQVHQRKVFELAPAKIEHKGAELLWDAASLPAEPLSSADWLIKDVGFAYRIGVRLVAENRVLDLQLPHPMDLRYL
jgi:hypothetical protein